MLVEGKLKAFLLERCIRKSGEKIQPASTLLLGKCLIEVSAYRTFRGWPDTQRFYSKLLQKTNTKFLKLTAFSWLGV